MRNLVIDYARRRQAAETRRRLRDHALPTEVPEQVTEAAELERLAAAIDTLGELDPALA